MKEWSEGEQDIDVHLQKKNLKIIRILKWKECWTIKTKWINKREKKCIFPFTLNEHLTH